jgi:hypothetical protein
MMLETTFPFGFEASTTFYLVLYVLTWVLHVAFMGYVLAGSFYVAWATVFPGKSLPPRSEQPICELLREWIPFMLSGAITAGVAPLLFVQIIYRQEFYTANLLLGWRWLMVIPVLIVAFYLLYLLKSRAVATWSLAARAITVAGVAGSFLFVAFCWTTNHLLGINRDGWANSYETGTVVAAALPLVLRLLTWVAGVFPVMCLIVAWQLAGRDSMSSSSDTPVSPPARALARMAIGGLLVAVISGVAYATQLPDSVRQHLLGAAGQAWLYAVGAGVVLQVFGWVHMLRQREFCRRTLSVISVASLVTLTGTASLREIVRVSQIDLLSIVQNCHSAADVGGFTLFVVCLVLNILLVGVCLLLTRTGLRRQ